MKNGHPKRNGFGVAGDMSTLKRLSGQGGVFRCFDSETGSFLLAVRKVSAFEARRVVAELFQLPAERVVAEVLGLDGAERGVR